MAEAEDVLGFWFGRRGETGYGLPRPVWFERDPAFDQAIRERFLGDCEAALAGERAAWRFGARRCLALILLLDQFPRNLFRDSPRAYAGDAMALETARHAVDRAYDRALPPVMRQFVYLPYQHSESLADQERSIPLFAALPLPDCLDYALRHRAIVARFGRFPHRNAALGRASTPEETAFLAEPGPSF